MSTGALDNVNLQHEQIVAPMPPSPSHTGMRLNPLLCAYSLLVWLLVSLRGAWEICMALADRTPTQKEAVSPAFF